MKTFLATITLLAGVAAPSIAQESPDVAPLKTWVEEVKSINSLVASFKQSRSLITLRTNPETTGNLWFQKPNKFRWELGNPARTIAIHTGEQLVVMDTKDKEAKVVNTADAETRKDVGAYFDLVFPRSWAEFESKLAVKSATTKGNYVEYELEPRSEEIAPGLKVLTLTIDPKSNLLQSFVFNRENAGSITVVFTKYTRNVYLPMEQFKPALNGYTVKRG